MSANIYSSNYHIIALYAIEYSIYRQELRMAPLYRKVGMAEIKYGN